MALWLGLICDALYLGVPGLIKLLLTYTMMVFAAFNAGLPATAQQRAVSEQPEDLALLEPVRMGFLDFRPYSYLENGKPAGPFLLDSIKIFERKNIAYELIELPIARLYQDIQSGKIHVWPGIHGHMGHDLATIRVETPINIIRLRIYGQGPTPPPSIEAMRNTSMIVIGGFQYAGLFTRFPPKDYGLNLIPARDHEAAFQLMVKGRAPYVLDYMRSADRAIRQLGIKDTRKTIVEDIAIRYYVSLKAPAPLRLVEILTNGQKELQAGQ